MKNIPTRNNYNLKQTILPLFISDFFDICDPRLIFDRFMEEISLEIGKKYL